MTTATLDSQLDCIEQQFNELSALLLDGDPRGVEVASKALQQLAVELLHMVDQAGPTSLQSNARAVRIKTLASVFPLLRGNVLRRSAFVDRALETIIPNASQSTYAGQAKTYGSSMRQSGAFKVLSA
jgi:hypothetical protein